MTLVSDAIASPFRSPVSVSVSAPVPAPAESVSLPGLTISDWRALDSVPQETIDALNHRYRTAEPFPHLVLEDFLDAAILDEIVAEFDTMRPSDWLTYSHALQTKLASRPNTLLPRAAQNYFDRLYSGPFVRFLSKVTGIPNLVTDPGLSGGGMHQIGGGGRFDVHVDFQKHPENKLDNRLVVITYLNRDWREEYGGRLELWRQNPAECATIVLPKFGRTLIMEESLRGAHGHPQPVNAPDGRPRRSVAAYFYTNGRDDGFGGEGLKTAYVHRPGRTPRQRLELLAQQLLPPIIVSGIKALTRR